jgi:protein TonB
VFTKIRFPVAEFYFMESSPALMLGNIRQDGIERPDERPWIALGLVLCAHLAIFSALRPQAQPLSVEPVPEPITVSLLSEPQATPQKPVIAATPIEKLEKPVNKPVKKTISKPVLPRIKPITLPSQTAMPVAETSAPNAGTETQANNKQAPSAVEAAADSQPYQSPNFNAAYLNNPAPNYPPISRRLGEQGLVLLQVQVTADGTAGSVELQTGSGSTRLDQAALEAVKKWRFTPAKRGKQPVSAAVTVPVRFSLEG